MTGSDRHTEEESIRVEKKVFSLRDSLYLEISKLSRMRSSKLEEDLQEEMMEKSLGEMA